MHVSPHGLMERDQPKFDPPAQRPEMCRRVEAVLLAHNVEDYKAAAREVIEAMREPTDAMRETPEEEWSQEFDAHRADDSSAIWRLFIGRALK